MVLDDISYEYSEASIGQHGYKSELSKYQHDQAFPEHYVNQLRPTINELRSNALKYARLDSSASLHEQHIF